MEQFPFHLPEILAPATSKTYKTAVTNGANAIYFGYGSLNARANADNLTELDEIVRYCHTHNVKAYLAFNVMIKESELAEAEEIIIKASKAHIDAFIISDLALLPIIRKHSDAAVHASTQMGIHNSEGARFAEKLGLDRVILSREISRFDLEDILNLTSIEVETFVHGALCIAFSGACLFSAMLTGKSGNRGRCAQLCRREYTCYIDGREAAKGYLLSAKDLCMASQFDDFRKLGVDSLKIEGRLKNEEYIAAVTNIYAELREGVPYSKHVEDDLKIVFNRGNFACGYWDNKDVVYPYAPNHLGLEVGRVGIVLSKNLVGIISDRPLRKGDCLRISRKGDEIGGAEVTGEVKEISEQRIYVAFAPCDAKVGDKVAITKRVFSEMEPFRSVVDLCVRMVADEPLHIIATDGVYKYELFGDNVPRAISQPLSQYDVARQLGKTGDTDYDFLIEKIVTDNAFYTKKQLNDMRRDIIEYFETKRIEQYATKDKKAPFICPDAKPKIKGDFIEVETVGQLSDYVNERIKNIVYSPRKFSLKVAETFYKTVKKEDNLVFIKLPVYLSASQIYIATKFVELFDGVFANNPGSLFMGIRYGKKAIAGWSMNIANSRNPLIDIADQYVASPELKYSELKPLTGSLVYAYGRLPLMNLKFCPKRLAGRTCAKCKDNIVTYRDNKGEYPIIFRKIEDCCQHELRNSVVTNIGLLVPDHPRYYDFCGCKKEEIVKVLKTYFYTDSSDVTGYNPLRLNSGVE